MARIWVCFAMIMNIWTILTSRFEELQNLFFRFKGSSNFVCLENFRTLRTLQRSLLWLNLLEKAQVQVELECFLFRAWRQTERQKANEHTRQSLSSKAWGFREEEIQEERHLFRSPWPLGYTTSSPLRNYATQCAPRSVLRFPSRQSHFYNLLFVEFSFRSKLCFNKLMKKKNYKFFSR